MSPAKTKKDAGPAVIDASRDARKLATIVLEVLSGMRTTTEAAEALEVSLPRYYTLELRAINGLIAACEPRPKGRVKSRQSRIDDLEKENARLMKECSRHQALLRTAQRVVGITARAKTSGQGKNGGRKRRRNKPRAVKVVGMLKKQDAGEAPATS